MSLKEIPVFIIAVCFWDNIASLLLNSNKSQIARQFVIILPLICLEMLPQEKKILIQIVQTFHVHNLDEFMCMNAV